MKNDHSFSLEINNNLIKLAFVELENSLINIKNLGLVFFESNFFATENEEIIKKVSEMIKNLARDSNVSIKNVNIILPNDITFSQITTMPYLNEKELISAIKFQADRFIPLPLEETNIDLEILEEKKDQNQLLTLIIGAPKKIIEKVKNITEMAGLIPDSVENELSAVARFFTQLKLANFVLDLNYNYTTLYFFDPKDYILKETYILKIGYVHFLKEVQINSNLKINQCEELVKTYNKNQKNIIDISLIINPLIEEFVLEINRFVTLVSAKYQTKIDKAFVFNYVINFPSFVDFLNNKLPFNFKILDFSTNLKQNPLATANKHNLPFFPAVIGGNFRE